MAKNVYISDFQVLKIKTPRKKLSEKSIFCESNMTQTQEFKQRNINRGKSFQTWVHQFKHHESFAAKYDRG